MMNKIRVRFYIRVTLLLILIVILLQCWGLNWFESSTVKSSKPLANSVKPLKNLNYEFAENVSDERLPYGCNSINKTEILEKIERQNSKQLVLNEEKFGPLEKDSVVIIVQVHKQSNFLKQLIKSLSHARNISKALLIFSHDNYDDEINVCVQSIEFCKVIQIFYPHSLQLHVQKFPGTDPYDCPPNVGKEMALIMKCKNALYPDVYGNYRTAILSQMKHHWWWKANHVFDELEVTRNHTGLVLFLEDDQYVAEDFLYMLKLMQTKSTELCPHCNILCLGNTMAKYKYSKVECTPWLSGQQNIGIAFNRTIWSSFRRCAREFCTYDDYNWDWSLNHVSKNCLRHKLFALSAATSRVFRLGKCKIQTNSFNCFSRRDLNGVKRIFRYALKSGMLYPSSLQSIASVQLTPGEIKLLDRKHGKWSDPRDHQLCLNTVHFKSQEIFKDLSQETR